MLADRSRTVQESRHVLARVDPGQLASRRNPQLLVVLLVLLVLIIIPEWRGANEAHTRGRPENLGTAIGYRQYAHYGVFHLNKNVSIAGLHDPQLASGTAGGDTTT